MGRVSLGPGSRLSRFVIAACHCPAYAPPGTRPVSPCIPCCNSCLQQRCVAALLCMILPTLFRLAQTSQLRLRESVSITRPRLIKPPGWSGLQPTCVDMKWVVLCHSTQRSFDRAPAAGLTQSSANLRITQGSELPLYRCGRCHPPQWFILACPLQAAALL